MEETIKQIWPGWQIDREKKDKGTLGHGGFGDVYRIYRSINGDKEYAALKVITIPRHAREYSQLRQTYKTDEQISSYYADIKQSYEKEYATMAALKGHANIVYCDDLHCFEHPDHIGWDIHIKMELLTPLMEVLPKSHYEEVARKVGLDICRALMECQKLNIIHRDIKPQNIFLSRDGNFKLGDFGIARYMEGTQMGTVAGTPDYIAPEVLKESYSCQADIYSLGLVMYWMLNNYAGPFLPTDGTVPTASQKEMSKTRRTSGEQLPPPLYGSEGLKQIVLKACAFDPKKRYASARQMYKALIALDKKKQKNRVVQVKYKVKGSQISGTESLPNSNNSDSTVYTGPDSGEGRKTDTSASASRATGDVHLTGSKDSGSTIYTDTDSGNDRKTDSADPHKNYFSFPNFSSPQDVETENSSGEAAAQFSFYSTPQL